MTFELTLIFFMMLWIEVELNGCDIADNSTRKQKKKERKKKRASDELTEEINLSRQPDQGMR